MTSSPHRNQYVELVTGNRNFRLLWMGQIVSLLGDWFNLIASATLIAALTQSGAAVGGLFVVRMLAPFLVSPLAGVAADRYDRKQLLIATDLLRAMTVFGLLAVRDAQHVWLLYALTALQFGISGFFFPARSAILPDLVSRPQLGAANALSSATWSVMLAFGTALGGLASGAFGVYTAFVIDGLTFLLSAAILSRIRVSRLPALAESDRSVAAVAGQYVAGLRYLARHRDILAVVLHKAAVSLTVAGAYQVIQVALAEQVYVYGDGGGIGLGIMFAVVGVGTGIGPIVSRIFTGDRDRPMRLAIAVSYFISVVGLLIAAPLGPFPLFLLGMFLRGYGGGTIWVFSTQLLLQNVPDQVRGRVFASEFALFTVMNAVSAAAAGWALDYPGIGLTGSLWWLVATATIPALLWTGWLVATPATAPVAAGTDR